MAALSIALHPRLDPEIPKRFKDVRMIFVQQVRGYEDRLLGSDAGMKRCSSTVGSLQETGCTADKRMAGPPCGKRKMTDDAERVRQHIVYIETGEPKAEIKRVNMALVNSTNFKWRNGEGRSSARND